MRSRHVRVSRSRCRTCGGCFTVSCLSRPARTPTSRSARASSRAMSRSRAAPAPSKSTTLLFKATDKGCQDLARASVGGGASLEARDRFGAKPLSHAAAAGQDRARHAVSRSWRADRCAQSRRLHRSVQGGGERPARGREAAGRSGGRRSICPAAAGSRRSRPRPSWAARRSWSS